ncbi:MAG: hypothetical protein FJ115_03760 [Deltaproteobacteria bacterium]|nr:hypothetical protein [Deltaproteobacteria bacterium]MBM4322655.1 hypothetical protein [Deltaproteobacteria bacterium]
MMDKELKDFLDKKFTEVDNNFSRIDGKIDNLDKKIAQVDEKVDQKTEEVLHQFHIIAEDLGTKIKLVAEGVVNLNEKMDRNLDQLNKNMEQKHQDVLAAIKFSYAELDRRITTLEVYVKELDKRVRHLESH